VSSTNPVIQKWRSGEPTFGAWLSVASTLSAEAMAGQGFDYVCVDAQHGLIDFRAAAEMILAIHAAGGVPFARVPSNDFATVGRFLDAGALGIIVPMIASVEDVRSVVLACRYPPEGSRSFGPTRAALEHGADYFGRANGLVACVPMIETRAAIENLEDLLAVPGVDAVYVGPNDLSLALGGPPGLDSEGPYRAAHGRVAEACRAAGITAGIHANSRLAAKHLGAGYRMITVATDLGGMLRCAVRDLGMARGDGA